MPVRVLLSQGVADLGFASPILAMQLGDGLRQAAGRKQTSDGWFPTLAAAAASLGRSRLAAWEGLAVAKYGCS